MQEQTEASVHPVEERGQEIPLRGLWRSQYEIRMDAKGRISLPAQWREAGEYAVKFAEENGVNSNQAIYITEHLRYPALKVFNVSAWDWRANLLNSKSSLDPGVEPFKARVIGAQSTTIRMDDKRMTVLIDKIRRTYANLQPSKAVVLLGQDDHFQVWEPDNYQRFLSEDPDFMLKQTAPAALVRELGF